MVKPYQRIVSLVCIACETCECEKCNVEDLAKRIIDDVRADAIDECIALARAEIDFESQAEKKRFVEFMEHLKEQK